MRNTNIMIVLPPALKGPGMVKSPPLDIAHLVSVLGLDANTNVLLTDFRKNMGSQPVFMPDGKAYTCKLSMQYNNSCLENKFSIGHIDDLVDLPKMRSLKSYKLCQDAPTDCTQTRLGACCRRICFAYKLRTGEPFSPSEISLMLEMDSIPFMAVKEALTPKKVLTQHRASHYPN